jgi:hypothetical protein
MKARRRVVPLLLVFLAVASSHAQLNVNSIGAGMGLIAPLGDGGIGTRYVAYPELQLGGEFLLPYLGWSAYWGYWDDGIETTTISDQTSYSTHGHILGTRIAFFPSIALQQWPLPIALFGGVAHHFITYRIVDRYYTANITPEGTAGSNAFEFGLTVYASVLRTIQLRAEAEQYVGLGDEDFRWSQTDRRAYKLGAAYIF